MYLSRHVATRRLCLSQPLRRDARYRAGAWGCARRARAGMTALKPRRARQARKVSPSSRTGARRPGGLRPESEPRCGRGADRPAGVGSGLVDPSEGGKSGCESRPVTTERGIRFLLFRRAGRAHMGAVQQHGG